jgi:hypothetical protein
VVLCRYIEQEIKARKPGRASIRWFVPVVCLALACCWASNQRRAYMMTHYPHFFDDMPASDLFADILMLFSGIAFPGAIVGLPMAIGFNIDMLGRLSLKVEALGRLGVPASIPTIVIAMLAGSPLGIVRPLRTVAVSALAEVTARLRPEDYAALPGQTVPLLCRALEQADPEAKLVVLQALAVIGDGRAIRAVERIANMTQIPEVREAATNLLPILHQRAEESQAAGLLLRPSNATEDGEKVLLRAAAGGGAGTDEREMLMRGSERPEDGP